MNSGGICKRIMFLLVMSLGTGGGGVLEARTAEREGPMFLEEPPDKVDFVNSTGSVIPCSASGRPRPTIQWVTQDGSSSVSDVSELRHVRPDGSLVFPPFRADRYRQDVHMTVYRCIASNSVGSIRSRDVQVRAVIKQAFSVDVHTEYTYRRNVAVLRCVAERFVQDLVSVIKWIREPNIEVHSHTNAGGRFTILPGGELHMRYADLPDSQHRYRCQVRHRLTGDVVLSQTAGTVQVTETSSSHPPRITHTVSRMSVQKGHTVMIPCVAQGVPVPETTWYKQTVSGRLMLHSGHHVSILPGLLILQRVSDRDAGKYECFVNNSAGNDQAKVELIVTAPLSVRINPSHRTVDLGSSVTLECIIEGYPVDNIVWLKNRNSIFPDNHIQLLSRERLHIASLERSDRGSYQCFVYNDVTSAQGTAQLLIGDRVPEFLSTFDSIVTNASVKISLRCVATGNPLPQITWTLDGHPIREDDLGLRVGDYVSTKNSVVSFVNISSVGVQHGGSYQCQAKNDVGEKRHRAMLTVYGPPYVRVMPNLTAVAGDTVVVQCPFGGHPYDTINWERNGIHLPENHRQTVYPNGTLVVQRMAARSSSDDGDNGQYTCIVRNKQGQTAKNSMHIRVVVKPVIEPFHLPAQVHMNQRLSITCTVSKGDPVINVTWLRNGQALPHFDDVTIHTPLEFSSTLLFKSVRPEHRGNYTCLASNDAGTASYSSSMIIHVPPRWTMEPSDTAVVKGRTMLLDCQADGFPAPRIRWQRATGQVPETYKPLVSNYHIQVFENGTLAIMDAVKEDEGQYLCQASNGIGTELSKVVRIKVHVAAHFKTKFKADMIQKGETSVLKCEAMGERPITVHWAKDKINLKESGNRRYNMKETILGEGIISELQIQSVDRRDNALFTCIAENAFGRDETNRQLIVQEPPDSPRDVKALDITSRTIRLSWSSPYSGNARLTDFKIFYEELNGEPRASPKTESVPAAETSWTLTALKPVTRYAISVAAINALGESEPSSSITVTTDQEAPGAPPKDVKVLPLSSSTVKVKWKPPEASLTYGEIKGYYVGYKELDSSEKHVYKTVSSEHSLVNECLLTTLRRSTRYSIRVQAFNEIGASPPSEEITVQTLHKDPPKAPEVKVLSTTQDSVEIGWANNEEDSSSITGYTVSIKKDQDDWSESKLPGEMKSHNFRGLRCGSKYQVQVVPFSAVGTGDASSVLTVYTKGEAPIPPKKEYFLQVNATYVLLNMTTWRSGGCPVTGFQVRYKTRPDSEFLAYSEHIPLDQATVAIYGLSPGTWYDLQVTAQNEAGSRTEKYTFFTLGGSREPSTETVFANSAKLPFYLELEIILPVSLSVFVVLVVLVLVCFVLRKRSSSQSTYGDSSTYGIRKPACNDVTGLSEIDRFPSSKRSLSKAQPIYYPTPYAMTQLNSAERDKCAKLNAKQQQLQLQDESQYATVKRTPRPPRPEVHVYHYPEFIDDVPCSPSHRSEGLFRAELEDRINSATGKG